MVEQDDAFFEREPSGTSTHPLPIKLIIYVRVLGRQNTVRSELVSNVFYSWELLCSWSSSSRLWTAEKLTYLMPALAENNIHVRVYPRGL